jgi:hypothetical protein
VTYPDKQVADLLTHNFVPVQVNIEEAGELADRFQTLWTPNLNMIDDRGKRFYHVVGWLPPSEFAAMLKAAQGHYFLTIKKYAEATPIFSSIFDEFPRSIFAPEALYFKGVSRYMGSHIVENLKEDWTMLQRFFPDSEWAMKSNV